MSGRRPVVFLEWLPLAALMLFACRPTEPAAVPAVAPAVNAIVVLVEVGLVLGLPRLLPMPQGGHAALMNAALLALLTAPTLYWRCMQATRRAGLLRD